MDSLSASNLKTGRAYRIRLAFQELYLQPAKNAEAFLKKWCWWATHSRLPPMIEAARMVKRHWSGILRWFQTKIANGSHQQPRPSRQSQGARLPLHP